jgi:uncharacterized protein YwqG
MTRDIRGQLERHVRRHGFAAIGPVVVAHARTCVFAETRTPDRYHAVGNTRFGGVPDLPSRWKWPSSNGEYFAFLCQIRLADLDGLDHALPRSGVLYVFLGDNGSAGNVELQVRHFDGDPASLHRVDLPEDAPFRHDDEDYREFPHKARFRQGMSLPGGFRDEVVRTCGLTDEEAERYDVMKQEWYRKNAEAHQLLGHPQFSLYDPRESAAAGPEGVGEWTSLFALGFDRKVKFCFWDAGTLHVLIRERDLARGRFTHVHGCIDSP